MIKDDALIEYAQFVGNYYGTPKAYVEEQLEAGKDVILEIEIQGALKVKEKIPGYIAFVCDTAECQRVKKPSDRQRNRDDGRDRVKTCKSR